MEYKENKEILNKYSNRILNKKESQSGIELYEKGLIYLKQKQKEREKSNT